MKKNKYLGQSWDEVKKEIFTEEEILECDLKVAIICELIEARKKQGISQKKLEELSGVKQPVIARIEKGITNPTIETILKVLAPLGKTLGVIEMKSQA